MKLKGKVAAVTGAAQGNGRGIAERLAQDGATVVLSDIDGEAAEAVAAELRAAGHDCVAVRCDVTDEEDVRRLIDATVVRGGPHVLVVQAGLQYSNLIPDITVADWERVFAVDVKGTFLPIREAIPHMVELGGGSIVTMSGTYVTAAEPGHALHSAVKGAVLAFTRGVAVEWGHKGIRCNALVPGWINTPMVKEAFEARPPEQQAEVTNWHALGRVGEPYEIGALASFLASDDSAFCTGQPFVIDGGQTAGVNSFQKPFTVTLGTGD